MGAIFLNIDLILKARFDLRPLVKELTNKGLDLLGEDTAKGGVWRATLESDLVQPTPERSSARILTGLEGLDEANRSSWQRCLSRRFDFGFECCGQKFESSSSIANPLVSRIANAGATIAVTIYRSSAHDPAIVTSMSET
jgi:hypothetical protein